MTTDTNMKNKDKDIDWSFLGKPQLQMKDAIVALEVIITHATSVKEYLESRMPKKSKSREGEK